MEPGNGSAAPKRSGLALFDLVLTVALPLSTQLADLTGRGKTEVERARESEGPITPANGAFVIWAPIFACLLAYGVRRVRARGHETDAGAEALVRASLIGNVLWSLNAQFKDLGWQSLALIGASAAAATGSVARLGRLSGPERVAANLLAPLAGWLSVATFANLDTTLRLRDAPGRRIVTPPVILAAATAATIAGVGATGGNPVYAAAAGWGLGGIAVKNARRGEPRLAAIAVAGFLAVAAATVAAMTRAARRRHLAVPAGHP